MTAPRPDSVLPIDVDGELRLEGPSQGHVTLSARGSRLTLAVPGWADLHGFGPRSLRSQRRALKRAISALRRLSLSLTVHVDGDRAFEFGEGVRTTFAARLLGVASADLRFADLISLLRSRGAAQRANPQ